MARYAIANGNQTTTATPFDTMLGVTGGTSGRVFVYDFSVGSSATPADNALVYQAQRATAAGTSTASTPTLLDAADVAATAAGGVNHSIEPTYTAGTVLWRLSVNQRASYRWVAAPGSELIVPATANNGIGWRAEHGSFTGDTECGIFFQE